MESNTTEEQQIRQYEEADWEQIFGEDWREVIKQVDTDHFSAGIDDFELLLDNPAWQDIVTMLNERLDRIRGWLEALDSDTKLDHINKGRAHEVKQLLVYPERAINILKLKEAGDDNDTN